MLKTCVAIGLTLLLSVGIAAAETMHIRDAAEPLSVNVTESHGGRTVIEYELGSFTIEPVEIDGLEYHRVKLGDESLTLERGMPALPNVCRSVVVPGDARMEVRVLDSSYVDYPDMDVAPSKGSFDRSMDPATVAWDFDPFYGTDGWYPAELATAREPYIFRDVRGLTVVLSPFQYNPSTSTLRVYDSVAVEVVPVGPGEVNVLDARRAARRVREFESIYGRHFLNYDPAIGGAGVPEANARYTPVGEVGNMLVVSHADFMDEMQSFVDWKLQMGIPCEMVSVETAGSTAENIADYIQNYYDTYGLTFVLLVGDAAQLPTLSANGGVSDPSFSLVAGEDFYPDIFVGRISAEDASHVATQVERSIAYENAPDPSGEWYHRGTGIASNQGPGDDGEYDDEHSDFLRADLLAFTYTQVDQIYDPGATSSEVATALDEGRGIVNYTGHGSCLGWSTSGFTNADVNALENDDTLPFIWSVACQNGNFAYTSGPCFAEAWMRATNGGRPTGAVATLMSSINQDWDEPMDAQDEMVDLLVSGAKRTYGGLSMNGCAHMLDEYGIQGYDDFLSWHIFGDPSLRVRTDTPEALTVTHASTVDPSATTFEVTVDGIEGALCALYRDGELHGSALTDADGDATIAIASVLPAGEDVRLTVSAFNATPYSDSVQISEASAAIVEVAPSFFAQSVEPEGTARDTLYVGNEGEPQSLLSFDVGVTGAGMSRGEDASSFDVAPAVCEPGETLDLVFTLSNESTDGEWVQGASLRFPDGVAVNSCSDLTVSDRALLWNGAAGNAAGVVWDGNWWNVVYPGESATAVVNVTVAPDFVGNVDIIYGIEGDGNGDPPHSLSGTLMLDCDADPLFTLLAPNGNEAWGVGETRDVTWEPSGYPLLVDLMYTTDGGGSWSTFASGEEDDGAYSWTVNAPVSDNCLVRVALASDHDADDTSDASFSVFEPVDWLSVSPSGGSVPAGEQLPVLLDYDSTGMPEGEYFADVVVTSNGGDPVVVPVNMTVGSTGSDDRIPGKAVAYGNFPNPFGPSTRIAFSVPVPTPVTLKVYSVDGRLVRTIVEDEPYGPGRHTIPWDGASRDGDDVPAGVYFYRLKAGGTELGGKMILLR